MDAGRVSHLRAAVAAAAAALRLKWAASRCDDGSFDLHSSDLIRPVLTPGLTGFSGCDVFGSAARHSATLLHVTKQRSL